MTAAIALNRFGLGARPDEAAPADPQGWLLQQLERWEPLPPAWAAQPRSAMVVTDLVDEQRAARQQSDPQARQAAQQAYRRAARDRYVSAVGARVQSALDTATPFVERLVHFWSNHFAVSVDKVAVVGLAGAFEADAIRPHVLGRFEDLLLAVVRHPAMLLFLDQAQSVGPDSMAGRRSALRADGRARGLNENLAREILELHTLGVRSGYTQADVTEFARALTGWSVVGANDPPATVPGLHGYAWRPQIHEPGTRTVLQRAYPQAGEQQAFAILHDLATAPATATHIATKLARHFVADDPPAALVQRLADSFLRTGGDLAAVARTLVTSREAWQPGTPKFKTPWDWAVSTLRGLGRRELPPMQAANLLNQLGQPVWRPGSPAGWDDIAASWAAPDALVRRVEVAQRVASQAGDAVDARQLARRLLPDGVSESTATQLARADSAGSALALLLVSPEFLRR
ncbi:DUF1800 domain-containing protein [Ramlibacter sp. MMS24-I3-19]|uniref:DUF1800 domain-containing protein n=1 Tax=Ramlibacter sp. MMS24-I3-19 TaxID=3416606 RepID=UPI003CFDAB49